MTSVDFPCMRLFLSPLCHAAVNRRSTIHFPFVPIQVNYTNTDTLDLAKPYFITVPNLLPNHIAVLRLQLIFRCLYERFLLVESMYQVQQCGKKKHKTKFPWAIRVAMPDPQEPSGQGQFPPPYSLCEDEESTFDSSNVQVQGNIFLSCGETFSCENRLIFGV